MAFMLLRAAALTTTAVVAGCGPSRGWSGGDATLAAIGVAGAAVTAVMPSNSRTSGAP